MVACAPDSIREIAEVSAWALAIGLVAADERRLALFFGRFYGFHRNHPLQASTVRT